MDHPQQTEQINRLASFGFCNPQNLLLQQGATYYFHEASKSGVVPSLQSELVPDYYTQSGLRKCNIDTCTAPHASSLHDLNSNIAGGSMYNQGCTGLVSSRGAHVRDCFISGHAASASSDASPLNDFPHYPQAACAGAPPAPPNDMASQYPYIAYLNPDIHLEEQHCENGARKVNLSMNPNFSCSWNRQGAPSLPAVGSNLRINDQISHDFLTSSNGQTEAALLASYKHDTRDAVAHEQVRQCSIFSNLSRSYPRTGSSSSTAIVLRKSKYLRAAQQLLEEVCSVKLSYDGFEVASTQSTAVGSMHSRPLHETNISGPGISKQWMTREERYHLQERKALLVGMAEELDRRYQRYRDKMQLVVTSFESAAGMGSAAPYTSLVRKFISRQFKALRNSILDNIRGACVILGEDISSIAILNKGETPRLRIIDRKLRHQQTLQQVGILQPQHQRWRPQRSLPERSVAVLRAWLFEHFLHPYPKESDKLMLARLTGLTRTQISNWFINARVRLWKPMVEKMYADERKEAESEDAGGAAEKYEEISNIDYGPNGGSKGDFGMEMDQQLYVSAERNERTSQSSVMTKGGVSLTLALQRSSSIALEPNPYEPTSHPNLLHPISGVKAFNCIDTFR